MVVEDSLLDSIVVVKAVVVVDDEVVVVVEEVVAVTLLKLHKSPKVAMTYQDCVNLTDLVSHRFAEFQCHLRK